AASAIAALPRTRCDGIPQKLLNYMAAGKAVVASAGSAKVLEHGRTGLVVPDNDEEAFARALATLVAEPAFARTLGRAAKAFVERHCSWGRAAERVESLYTLLSGRTFRPTGTTEEPVVRPLANSQGA
ncbi:MAG TPA: glycosyltransferase, partial [Rhodospirillales bacterium]|nr:glycosyltransferase [Rhodospirillales bacterium]